MIEILDFIANKFANLTKLNFGCLKNDSNNYNNSINLVNKVTKFFSSIKDKLITNKDNNMIIFKIINIVDINKIPVNAFPAKLIMNLITNNNLKK